MNRGDRVRARIRTPLWPDAHEFTIVIRVSNGGFQVGRGYGPHRCASCRRDIPNGALQGVTMNDTHVCIGCVSTGLVPE